MFDKEFYQGYMSKSSLIQEGYAHAISAQWFKKFKSYLMNPHGADLSKIGQIENYGICDITPDVDPNLTGYQIPQIHSTKYLRVYKVKPQLQYGDDYDIVSIEIWKFLKMYYNADYDVIVFVTKIIPSLTNYFLIDNLDQGLCICNELFYLVLVIFEKDDKSHIIALRLPACPWIEFVKFRTLIFSATDYQFNSIKFINHGHLCYDDKKVPFKGNKILKDMGITKEMQIIIEFSNMILGDIEEEIETDGEDQQIQQNLHTKQEFLEILEQNLNQQSTEQLILKSIQEIQQSLEQNDFFQV
ncbi:unnamed protein product [Paramecium primaurelia]|uniref:DUSP domain-containing protein n=1 Tax=Paramecium primaurelia TaxID=5886 RepID=A0A8S1QNV1_PARPR|nr:unnamed protein product [Paramecium primaurelia]